MRIVFDHKFAPFGSTQAEINKNGIIFLSQKDNKTGDKHYIILTPEQIKLCAEASK